jgi:RNA polymerase sigma factor (sigma-70 family)
MSARSMTCLIRHLRRTALLGRADQDLLDAFVSRHEEAAFEVLLKRHGPMVLAVCRRVLGNADDAEDAFQAVFLVLVRKAASIRRREVVGSWLYGVAYRTAQKAKAMNARRRIKEGQAAAQSRSPPPAPAPDLDKELSALPEKYRTAVVLCELEGRPRREAARLLNIAEGTLSSRLATARKMLAQRLRRQGSLLPGVVAGTVPAALLSSTLQAAGLVAAGKNAAGVISSSVLALTEGMVKAMFVNKLKMLVVVLVVGGTLGIGTGRLTYSALAQDADGQARPGTTRRDPGPTTPASMADLEATKAALEQAQVNLQRSKAALELHQADLARQQQDLAMKMAAYKRLANEARARGRGSNAQSRRTATPQERLAQLEGKLTDILHEVQALRSEMEGGRSATRRATP